MPFSYIFRSIFMIFIVYKKLIRYKKSFLHESGWIQSVKRMEPVDNNFNQVPWMNYQTINFIKERFKKDFNMFEYGSGYSTIFYANIVNRITSIEYNIDWYNKIKNEIPNNAKLIYENKFNSDCYIFAVKNDDILYDVIIIDGRSRVACLEACIDQLSERGVLFFDDSERDRYRKYFDIAYKRGFRSLDFQGIKPVEPELSCTTIFYRDGNCLGL